MAGTCRARAGGTGTGGTGSSGTGGSGAGTGGAGTGVTGSGWKAENECGGGIFEGGVFDDNLIVLAVVDETILRKVRLYLLSSNSKILDFFPLES